MSNRQPNHCWAQVPDEARLLQAVCDKVGPSANKEKLLWHLRASRGKVHWAGASLGQELCLHMWPIAQHMWGCLCFDSKTAALCMRFTGWAADVVLHVCVPAVNSYLRAVLTTSQQQPRSAREDFDPRPPSAQKHTSQQQQQVAAAAAAHADVPGKQQQQQLDTLTPQLAVQEDSAAQDQPSETAAAAAVQLDGLPGNVLEHVLSFLDLASLLNAACSCQGLNRAAQAEGLWLGLFQARWGALLFPVNTCGRGSSSSRSSPCGRMSAATTTPAAAAAACAEGTVLTAAFAQQQRPARAPVPLFGAQSQVVPATTPAGAGSAHHLGSAAGTAGRTKSEQQLPQQHQQQQLAVSSSFLQPRQAPPQPDSDFVGRWTGSSCISPSGTAADQDHEPAQHDTLTIQSAAAAAAAQAAVPAAVDAAAASSPIAQQLPQTRSQSPCQATTQQPQQQQPEGRAAEQLPSVAPCGSWQRQFKQQYAYQASRLCPKCGVSSIVPIVYGFPSPGLLSGMAVKRLVLGGDHLIESCHVWACAGCRSCFRFYPYVNVELWVQDDAAQQRQDHARAAAASGRGSRRGGVGGAAVGGGEGGGAAAAQQQQQVGPAPGSDAAGEGFPRYTYEL